MKNASLIGIVAAMAFGFYFGYKFKANQPADTEVTIQRNGEAIEKLQQLADTELADYYRLKTLEEKYKKADELLAKMVTILLADLGIKLSQGTRTAMANAEPVNYGGLEEAPKAQAAQAGNANAIATPQLGKAQPQRELKHRLPLEDLRNDDDITRFLRESALNDLDLLKDTTPFATRNGTINNINGKFVGTADVTENSQSVTWEIQFEFHGRIDDSMVKGRHHIRMLKNGEPFTTNNSNGDLDKEYRELAGDPQAIIVGAGPKTALQLYYIKGSDSFIGNALKRSNKTEPFKTIGTVKLQRSR